MRAATGSTEASLVAMGHAGQIAMLYAATYPERVNSLVLLNSYARLAQDLVPIFS